MDHEIKPAHPDDIFLWPDGTHCYRWEYELGHYQQMSDDFQVLAVDSARWLEAHAETVDSFRIKVAP